MHRPVLSASLHLTRACLSALRLLRSSPLIRSWMLLASWLSAEGLQMGAAASTAGSETAGPPHEQRAFWPPWSTAARFATAPHWSSNVWSSIALHKLYQSSPDCLHSQPNLGLTQCIVFSFLSDWAHKTLTMISTALFLPYCCLGFIGCPEEITVAQFHISWSICNILFYAHFTFTEALYKKWGCELFKKKKRFYLISFFLLLLFIVIYRLELVSWIYLHIESSNQCRNNIKQNVLNNKFLLSRPISLKYWYWKKVVAVDHLKTTEKIII